MKNCGKAVNFAEIIRCLAIGDGNYYKAANYAEAIMPWNKPVVSALKAAVGATSLADLEGNNDYLSATENFFESLRGKCIFDTLTPSMHEVPPASALFTCASIVDGSVGSGTTSKPITKLNMIRQTIEPETASAIIVVSNEGLSYSGAKALILRELTSGVSAATDRKLFADLDDFVGSSAIDSSVGDPAVDLKALLDQVAVTGSERLFLAVNPGLANGLSCATDPSGLPAHPDMTPAGGSLYGVQCLVSDSVPGGKIYLIDADGIAYAQHPLEIQAATAGLVDLSDDPAGNYFVSLFQNDLTALKISRHFGLKLLRENAVAVMDGVEWFTESSSM